MEASINTTFVNCPHCDAEVPAEAAFCDNCGSPIALSASPVVSIPCPHCGALVMPDDAFCDSCGHALEPSLPVDETGAPEPPDARLVEPQSNDVFMLTSDRDEFVIGRLDPASGNFPDIDLVPYGGEEGGVSRRHARIFRRNERYFIEDLNSVNYTFLNRQKLPAGTSHPIGDGDEVRFGRVVLVFYTG